ncbi:MAG: hypothetical protein Q8Q33_07850 [Chlamydiota bacterium]|nr:hypothetical protein [Chlamydiota bacterium]
MMKSRFWVILLMIVFAAGSRLVSHPPNFTPLTAMALFAGAYLLDNRFAFLVPMAAMFLSDLILGFHAHMVFVYGSFVIMIWMGTYLRTKRSVLRVGAIAISGSILFFIITNFGVGAVGSLYPKTIDGFIQCYLAAIPFFRNMLGGDLVFSTVLFGAFEMLQQRVPALRPSSIAAG